MSDEYLNAIDNSSDYQIKKHSSIVQISNITTLQERKTMNALIRIAKDVLKREPDQNSFKVDIGIIRRLVGIKGSDNELLKNALRNLKNSHMEYNVLNKDKKEWGIFSFLARANIVEFGR